MSDFVLTCESAADRTREFFASRNIPVVRFHYEIDALRLHARRRHGHTLALGGQPIQQLGDPIEHGVLLRPQLIKKGAVLVGHHKRLLAGKAVKVVKALPQGRPDHTAQITHLRLRKPARSQRLARRGHHCPARICHRAVKIEQHDRPR